MTYEKFDKVGDVLANAMMLSFMIGILTTLITGSTLLLNVWFIVGLVFITHRLICFGYEAVQWWKNRANV